ncbi:uncharacterized protein A4U43_C08F15670 [Asparagus officinalis]|nr:uncharacterized protein A4U43_C08F15670 [Asparagus officinalis]
MEKYHDSTLVTNYLDALKEIERKGGLLVLDVDNEDEGGEKSEEGSAKDSWASWPGDDQEKVVGSIP